MELQTNEASPIESSPSNEMQFKKLQYLALNFDPYKPYYNHEIENIIKEFNLTPLIENPFYFTNRLLQLLDQFENQLKLNK